MTQPAEDSLIAWLSSRLYNLRRAFVGRVREVTRESSRERDVDVEPGPGSLQAGEAVADDVQADIPMLHMGGGGFFFLMPSAAQDEALGIVTDRALGTYRQTRKIGDQSKLLGKRSGDLADTVMLPFALTAPSGAPDSWGSALIGGPAGVAVQVDEDGAVTITKQGTPVASISMPAGGSVTIEVAAGQSVNLGGPAAVELPKWAQLEAAVDALLAAGSSAGTGAPGTTGKLAFDAAIIAWNTAKSSIPTTKAKGE